MACLKLRALEGRSPEYRFRMFSEHLAHPQDSYGEPLSIYGDSNPVGGDGIIMEDVVNVSATTYFRKCQYTISSAIGALTRRYRRNQILKDGSATSVHGARAMACSCYHNQKGRAGQQTINYIGATSRLKPAYRDFNMNLNNKWEFIGKWNPKDG